MKLLIHFREDGQILSVAKVHVLENESRHPFIHAENPDQVIEVEATPELQDLDAHEIAEQYVIDTDKGALRKKKAEGAKKAVAKKRTRQK